MEISLTISTVIQAVLFLIMVATALIHIIYKRLLDDINRAHEKTEKLSNRVEIMKKDTVDLLREIENHQMIITNNMVEHFVKKVECEKKYEEIKGKYEDLNNRR